MMVSNPDVELVGLLPPERQDHVTFAACVVAAAKEPQAGQVLIQFPGPSAAAALRAKGMTPD